MSYVNRGKRQYSESEKIAYHGGRAWAIGKSGQYVQCKNDKCSKSFRNGVHAERNKMKKGVK